MVTRRLRIAQAVGDWRRLSSAQRRAWIALAAILVLAQIRQPFPEIAWLHHLPTLLVLLAAPALLRRWPLSDGATVAIALFLALHTLGGRYTYSSVPYDEWARALTGMTLGERFGWTRNHYDRLVHFAFGLLWLAPFSELVRRHLRLSAAASICVAIMAIVAAGAFYEIFEWLLTLSIAPELAGEYNGEQGDMWDAQKDMALALVGALAAAICLAGKERLSR
jgi:putative membrane protein